MMTITDKPHPQNAPGPFYVCDGCCLACGIPWVEAPDMFVYDEEVSHCYVIRQPQTPEELYRMILVVAGSELECVRYGGSDPAILTRLAEAGLASFADEPIKGITPVYRDHVTFDAIEPHDKLLSERDLATAFQKHLRSSEHSTYKFTPLRSDGKSVRFTYVWFEDNFHPIEFAFIGDPENRWLIVSDNLFGVHAWLESDKRFCNIRWYTKEHWNTRGDWARTPC